MRNKAIDMRKQTRDGKVMCRNIFTDSQSEPDVLFGSYGARGPFNKSSENDKLPISASNSRERRCRAIRLHGRYKKRPQHMAPKSTSLAKYSIWSPCISAKLLNILLAPSFAYRLRASFYKTSPSEALQDKSLAMKNARSDMNISQNG